MLLVLSTKPGRLGPRTRRMLLGKDVDVFGVVGSILMDGCGERDRDRRAVPVGVEEVSILFDDTEDVLECE